VSGISVGELSILGETLTIPRSPNKLNDWLAIGEANNHLIKIRKLELEEAAKGISQEKGAYLPQVSFIVQRQDSDVGFDNRPIDRSDNTYVGVDVTIPLYAGGKNLARIREAKSIREIAASELRKAQLEIRENIRAAYLRLEASESIISAATLLLDSTTLTATAMQRGFELGAVTSVDVLEALQEQYRSERDLQRARYDQINSLLVLKREAGNLTIDDLIEVGSWLSPASPN
jgi:outer membrane protein